MIAENSKKGNNKVPSLCSIYFPKEELGDSYKTIKMIGKGSYGEVCKAKNKKTN